MTSLPFEGAPTWMRFIAVVEPEHGLKIVRAFRQECRLLGGSGEPQQIDVELALEVAFGQRGLVEKDLGPATQATVRLAQCSTDIAQEAVRQACYGDGAFLYEVLGPYHRNFIGTHPEELVRYLARYQT